VQRRRNCVILSTTFSTPLFWWGRGFEPLHSPLVAKYSSGEPHLPFQVKRLSSVLMDDLKVAHEYGGDDGA